MRLTCLAAAATIAAVAPAGADVPRRHQLGLTLALEQDGSQAHGNPLTNSLLYAPLALEVGHRLRPGLRVHASIGYGPLRGDETRGSTIELLAGVETLWCDARGR